MKGVKAAKNLAIGAFEPLEALGRQVAKPIGQEMVSQLFGFGEGFLSSRPKSLGGEELSRARKEKELKDKKSNDEENSALEQQKVRAVISQYQEFEQRENREQHQLHEQVAEMQEEVVKLAKAAGVDTNVHLETRTKKLGLLDIKRLTSIIRSLRIKAESGKDGSDLVHQRKNAKAGTGMMAWVSGKQMQVHEQGTMQLQG